jgi:hypothetical protein
MLNHPYWARVWIVQEVVVSQKVHICYGGLWWDWKEYGPLISSLNSSSNGLLQKMDLAEGRCIPSLYGIEKVRAIQAMRYQYHQGKRKTLPKLLLTFASSRATCHNDFVSAFQGISQAILEGKLIPSYKKSILQVFEEAVMYSFEASDDTFLLFSSAGVTRTRPGEPWPTWVLNFDRISGSFPPRLLCDYAPYRASHDTASFIYHEKLRHEVAIAGIFIDDISFIASLEPADPRLYTGFGDPDSDKEHAAGRFTLESVTRCREAQALAEAHTLEIYFNEQSRWEVFWRTHVTSRVCLCMCV